MPKAKCECPIYCQKCGRRRSKDSVGHYCKTKNCQWALGYPMCPVADRSRS
jgi:hypothetical protein